VAAERDTLDVDRIMAEHGDPEVAIAAVTASELFHGVHRAAPAGRRARREACVERLLERDLLIGATAMARGHSVATRDERSFPKIPGLVIVRC
jgi:predicted nucleic acid-binding protein